MPRLLQSPSFEFLWESQRGTFCLQSPGRALQGYAGVDVVQRGRILTLTSDKLPSGRVGQTTFTDAHGPAEEARIHCQDAHGVALSLRVRLYPSRPFAVLKIKLTNVGPDPLRVRRFFIDTLPGGLQTTEPPTGFYVNGWQSWSPSGFVPARARAFTPSPALRPLQGPMIHNTGTPWSPKRGRFWSETAGAVVTAKEALIAGGGSLADQFVQVYADVRPGHLAITLQSQADDVPLDVGEALTSEWFYLEWVPLPNLDPFAQYAHAVVRQMEIPTPRAAPSGWCSWSVAGNKVSEADVIENLASAALLADEVPLQVIQLDEGYQTAWGDWTERNDRFPHDFRWLAERIRGSGFIPGLWLAPLTAHPKSQLATAHPDWLLRDARKRPISPGLISGFFGRALDATHPDVQAHVRDLVHAAVHEWGYGYLKLDFMYAGALPGQRHNPWLTRAQALRQIFRVIREAAGPETYLVGCGAPLSPALGLVDALRIGPDTAPSWSPHYGRAGALMQRNAALPSFRNSARNVAARAWMHKRWWTNDPDTLLMRDGETSLTPDEVLAQTTLLGLSSGLALLSDDLDGLPSARSAMAAVLFPPLLDGMDVVDLFSNPMPEAVVVPVARCWGRWQLVGLFNWSDTDVERTLPDVLTLDERQAYHIVDFWERRYLRFEPDMPRPVFHVPPHGAALVGVRQAKPDVHLVATTFHISQGAEVTEWRSEEGALALTLDLGRLARGEVWLALPCRPTEVLLNDKPLPDKAVRAVAVGVWAVACYINRVGTLHVRWAARRS